MNDVPVGRRTALMTAAALFAASVAGCTDDRVAAVPSPPSSPSPSSAPSPVLPAEVSHGPRDRPAVALTFHGQGDPGTARLLLAALAGTPVTVLAVGTWLLQQRDLAREIVAAGHELGNHTQHHLDIASMAEPRMFAEISDCAAALRTVTGSIGRWFRPSQTQHSTPAIQRQAALAGYPTCLSYDVDSRDYTDPGVATIVRETLTPIRNGSIVSLHFGHPGTVSAVPQILAGLHSRGLRPVTMTDLMS